MEERADELKGLLMRGKEESEKPGLKLNIQKTKTMASGPITSWQIDRANWKQCQTLFTWAPKSLQTVTAAQEIKRHLLLEQKTMINLDSQLKTRDINLLTNVRIVKLWFF